MNIDDIETKSHIWDQMTVDFPDHYFVVNFNNDEDADACKDWWWDHGKDEFVKWCVAQKKENQDDD